MLLMSWLAPQEISLAFRKSPEIHGRAPLWSVLRAAYASDEGVATFTRGTRGGAHNVYSRGAREAEAGAGTSSSLLNGLAYQTAWGLLLASLVSYRPLAA